MWNTHVDFVVGMQGKQFDVGCIPDLRLRVCVVKERIGILLDHMLVVCSIVVQIVFDFMYAMLPFMTVHPKQNQQQCQKRNPEITPIETLHFARKFLSTFRNTCTGFQLTTGTRAASDAPF